MDFWIFVQQKIDTTAAVMLLYVLNSDGSSPGRQGFKMAVAADGTFYGTIGGGIMEQKLVEKAKMLLAKKTNQVSIVEQYHDKQHAQNQSGMICSGSQTIAFVPLTNNDAATIDTLLQHLQQGTQAILAISMQGLQLLSYNPNIKTGLFVDNNQQWTYTEALDTRPVIHLIGGGHVGLALSQLMHFLGFYVHIYDNRPNLNTLQSNTFAHQKHLVDYEQIAQLIPPNPKHYVVIATFGYRTDKTVLKQLYNKPYYYIGLMGSDAKINTLIAELISEGISTADLKHVFMPIGLPILSKTTQEIAVSIAAQIIYQKNKDLPTGRVLGDLP
jgi:xanthine dehydrogenase accessory factor